mmetsp:Transcript_19365/g.44620  ORF Transcript_19365/g.44620 Transcript_19365/m.44620 type:complete len:221 (-) Transcript_19365:1427-2089(-)
MSARGRGRRRRGFASWTPSQPARRPSTSGTAPRWRSTRFTSEWTQSRTKTSYGWPTWRSPLPSQRSGRSIRMQTATSSSTTQKHKPAPTSTRWTTLSDSTFPRSSASPDDASGEMSCTLVCVCLCISTTLWNAFHVFCSRPLIESCCFKCLVPSSPLPHREVQTSGTQPQTPHRAAVPDQPHHLHTLAFHPLCRQSRPPRQTHPAVSPQGGPRARTASLV